jgi:hypothetical protein
MEGYYKIVNGEWAYAPNGIVLPHTSEPTIDKEVMEANGWEWFNEAPQTEQEQ